MEPLTPRQIWWRTALALVLPIGIYRFVMSYWGRLFYDMAAQYVATRWCLVILVAVTLLLECRLLAILIRLIAARGKAQVVANQLASPQYARRLRRRRFGWAAAAAAMLLAFLTAEVVFRLADIGHPSGRRFGAPAGHPQEPPNPLGLREPWDELPANDPRFRLAFLGDSFTYGLGVASDETFVHRVEELLQPRVPGGVVTINSGKTGSAPGTQLPLYRSWRDAIQPDAVVQVLYVNDIGLDTYAFIMKIDRIRDAPLWVGEWSRVLAYAERQARYWIVWNKTLGFYRGGTTREERERAWTQLAADLEACRDTIRADGAHYAVVLFPWLYRLDDYPLEEFHERMAKLTSELEVAYLDLLPTYRGRDSETLRISSEDEHPTPLAYDIAAERIVRFVCSQNWFACDAALASPTTSEEE